METTGAVVVFDAAATARAMMAMTVAAVVLVG